MYAKFFKSKRPLEVVTPEYVCTCVYLEKKPTQGPLQWLMTSLYDSFYLCGYTFPLLTLVLLRIG